MSGRPSISAYTPSNTDPEVLKRIFVQREKLLERIVDRLSRSMTTGDKHHILLVGPRGSGKSHLVSLATWDLQGNDELNEVMRIAWLGEDDSFTGLVHLAFGIASRLAQEYPDEFPADFKTPVRGLSQDDAALAVQQSIIKQLGDRSLLLVTENMDQTFRSLGDSGQKKWRAFLQETRKIATLATAQQLFAGVSDRKEAFFGFFDIQHLEPLTVEEAAELVARISTEQSRPELASYLNSAEGRFRIRALHYLAGGNHRMYVLLAEFLTKDSLEDLVAAFENLAHDMTPYFQERVRSLPDQQRQLVQCLCDAEGALTVKQIAGETFIEERTCSKQLGNLKAKGYVRSEKRGKESYYDMAEPLMRLCLEVKNQRGRPLRMVARFLRAWFPATELQAGSTKADAGRAGEYCSVALESGGAFEAAIASRLVLQIRGNIKSGALASARVMAQELEFADAVQARMLSGEIQFLEGDFESSIESLTTIIEMDDSPVAEKARALSSRGLTYGQQGDVERALADYSAVIAMDDAPVDLKAEALVDRGLTYGQQGDVERALADYSAIIEMDDAPADQKATALYNRGVTYRKRGDIERALADYSAVIAMDDAPVDHKAKALYNRGVTYGEQGEVERKLADYSAVIEMNDAPVDQKGWALVCRGLTYGQQDDVERELADYSAVIEMDDAPVDHKAKALYNRGVAYGEQSDVERALADYSAVIEMDDAPVDQKAKALYNRGVTYGQQGDVKRELADYSAVIEMNDAPVDDKARALYNRGVAYGEQGDVERALADYSAVIEMDDAPVDQKAKALYNRGVTYGQQGDVKRELADYSAVIEMDDAPVDQKAKALYNRGVSYGDQGDVKQALADYSAVIEMDDAPVDQKAKALYNRGVTYGDQGDIERELADYSAVIDRDDAPVDLKAGALVNRGVTHVQQGNLERALADYSAVIEMDDAPVDLKAVALYNRGNRNWDNEQYRQSAADFEGVLALPSVSPEQRTKSLFAVPEPMIDYCGHDEVVRALTRAFDEGDAATSEYGRTPDDLLMMVLRRGPSEWANYVAEIAPLYIKHGVAEKLGQGVTQSIRHLDEGGFSESQIDTWNSAWQEAGKGCDDLEIPLRCLDAAVEVMKSDPPTDRPLFRLPLEIRGLVRPLLNHSLGERS